MDEKSRKALSVSARKELIAAVVEVRKSIWTKEIIDHLLPYPIYKVDAVKRTAVFANAIQITVRRDGRISSKALRPDVKQRYLKMDINLLAGEWDRDINEEYRYQLASAINKKVPCPKGWGKVRRLAVKVQNLSGGEPGGDMASWLGYSCPFGVSGFECV